MPPVPDGEQNDRSYVAVNAHELAHQWFGDYVTEGETVTIGCRKSLLHTTARSSDNPFTVRMNFNGYAEEKCGQFQ